MAKAGAGKAKGQQLLLVLVREVSLLADPDRPKEVSQREWDEARSKLSSKLGAIPAARSIARKLRLSWPEVVDLAHQPSTAQNQRLGERDSENAQHWLTAEHAVYMMKLVARGLGKSTLTEGQYDVERGEMIARNRRYYMHGRRLRMPTSDQICTLMQREIYGATGAGVPFVGTWERALELAELGSAQRARSKATRQPLPLLDLLDRYHDAHGVEPTPTRLWGFAREHDLPYAMTTGKRAWSGVVAVWRKRREAAGLPAPRPPEPLDAGEIALAHFRVRKKPEKTKNTAWGNREKCLLAIIAYLEELPAGKRATAKDYNAWASKQDTRAPNAITLRKHGGWSKMLEDAHQRMLAELTSAESDDQAETGGSGSSPQSPAPTTPASESPPPSAPSVIAATVPARSGKRKRES
jgi:hypothetical protein